MYLLFKIQIHSLYETILILLHARILSFTCESRPFADGLGVVRPSPFMSPGTATATIVASVDEA